MNRNAHNFSIIASVATDGQNWISEDSIICRCGDKVTVEFDRVAATVEEAIESAVNDILRIGGRIMRVDV
ncbi:hypothetical protein G6L37_04105 [Agrobacterium rubi]|nr:hypothetical protein [Agrobacterium rubi]NTF24534.1 hypothetical protein [Agrobacterium rubi]